MMYKKNIAPRTCFMPFSTAWTFDVLETAFCSLVVPPLSGVKAGVSGDRMGVSSKESASNFLELEIPCYHERQIWENWRRNSITSI